MRDSIRAGAYNVRYLYEVWRGLGFRAMVRGPLARWVRRKRGR